MFTLWAFDSVMVSTWTLGLFGLSALGLGLGLGRLLFGSSGAPTVSSAPRAGGAASGALSNSDLRTSPRTAVAQTKLLIRPAYAAGEPVEGWVTDRSLGGLGLSVPEPIEIGSILHLTPEEIPSWVTSLVLQVKYCRLHRGRWRLGCQYVTK